MPLRGKQLSLLPDVSPYLIENLPLPGEMMTTRSGVARVTRLEPLGEEIVIWGDYGSGIEPAILILTKSCLSSGNAGIVMTSERAKRASTVERTGVV